MNISFTKQFQKEIEKIPNHLRKKTAQVVQSIIEAQSLANVPSIKKIVGFEGYYRIRISSYRLGLFLDDSQNVTIVTICHRKDIYRKFP